MCNNGVDEKPAWNSAVPTVKLNSLKKYFSSLEYSRLHSSSIKNKISEADSNGRNNSQQTMTTGVYENQGELPFKGSPGRISNWTLSAAVF